MGTGMRGVTAYSRVDNSLASLQHRLLRLEATIDYLVSSRVTWAVNWDIVWKKRRKKGSNEQGWEEKEEEEEEEKLHLLCDIRLQAWAKHKLILWNYFSVLYINEEVCPDKQAVNCKALSLDPCHMFQRKQLWLKLPLLLSYRRTRTMT